MNVVAYGRVFEPPRQGSWDIDLTHFPRPATRYGSELFIKSFMPGFAESTKLYGLLLQGLDYIDVNGFMYATRRAVGAPQSSKGPPPKPVFKLLTLVHPEIRRRLARSRDVVEAARLAGGPALLGRGGQAHGDPRASRHAARRPRRAR